LSNLSDKWRISGANVCCNKHKVCQDAWAKSCSPLSVSVCVCDGAGSAKFSDEGASCASRFLAQEVVRSFDKAYYTPNQFIRVAIAKAKDKLRKIAKGRMLREFSCTAVLSAIHVDGRWVTFHIGDGAIIGRFADNSFRIISIPAKGEYENETFFITMHNAFRYAKANRSRVHGENLSGIALFSDGLEKVLFDHQTLEVSQAVKNIMMWQDNFDEKTVSAAIKDNIAAGRFVIDTIDGKLNVLDADDCSLVIITKNL